MYRILYIPVNFAFILQDYITGYNLCTKQVKNRIKNRLKNK